MARKKDSGQISMFDVELPPTSAPEPAAEPEVKIFPARVPDEEFTIQNAPKDHPKVSEILKLLEKGLYKVNAHEFLSNVFECGAIAISNKFDFRQAPEREERYKQIMSKYELDMRQLMAEVFAKIYALCSMQIYPHIGFDDYLGELYMRSETSNSKAGQFFTPYCISKACAECCISESMVEEYIQQDKIITMNEPACGAGGMILAAADILYNRHHFNIARNLLVECSDIDTRCVHMTYLQLGLAGIPAVIYQRDTLAMKTWQRWETPAYIMQWTRFKGCLSGGYEWYPGMEES